MSVDETILLPQVVLAVLKESGYDRHTATWTLGGDGQGKTMLTLRWVGNSSVGSLGTEVRALLPSDSVITSNIGIQTDVKKSITVATQTPMEWAETDPTSKCAHSSKQNVSSKKRVIKREERASDISHKLVQNDSFIGPGPNKVSRFDGFSSKLSVYDDNGQRLHRDKKPYSDSRRNAIKEPSYLNDEYMVQSREEVHSERSSVHENIYEYNHNGPMNSLRKRIICEENLITYNNKILTHAEIPGIPESKSIIYLKLHDQYGAAPKVANSQRAADFYNELYTGFRYGPDATEYRRLLPLLIERANCYLLRLASVMGIDTLPCPVPYLDIEMSEKTGLYVDIKL